MDEQQLRNLFLSHRIGQSNYVFIEHELNNPGLTNISVWSAGDERSLGYYIMLAMQKDAKLKRAMLAAVSGILSTNDPDCSIIFSTVQALDWIDQETEKKKRKKRWFGFLRRLR